MSTLSITQQDQMQEIEMQEINFVNLDNLISIDDVATASVGNITLRFSELLDVLGTQLNAGAPASTQKAQSNPSISPEDQQKIEELSKGIGNLVKIYVGSPPKAEENTQSSGPDIIGGMEAIFSMIGQLMQLQNVAIENAQKQSTDQANIGKVLIDALQQSYDELQKEIEKQNNMPWWEKAFSAVIKYVLPVVSFLSCIGNPAMLALTAVLFTLSETGALGSMSSEMSKLFGGGDFGNIMGDIATIGIVTGAAMAAGSVSAPQMSKLMATTAFATALGTSSLAADVANATGGGSNFQLGLQIFFAAVAVGATMYGARSAISGTSEEVAAKAAATGAGEIEMATLSSNLSEATETLNANSAQIRSAATALQETTSTTQSTFGTYLKNFADWAKENEVQIQSTLTQIGLIGQLAGSGAQVGDGFYKLDQAKYQRNIEYLKGNISLLTATEGINSSGLQQAGQQLKSTMQYFSQMVSTFSQLFLAYQAAAEVLNS